MIYPNGWEKVTCSDWCEDKRKIWLCLSDKNAICEIDKHNKHTKILGSFPQNGLGEGDLSLSVVRNGNNIIFCPFRANDIAILDVSTETLKFIDILYFFNNYHHANNETQKFYRALSYKNYILFFGIRYPVIMRLDLTTMKIDFYDEWVEKIEKHKCKAAVSFTDGHVQKKNKIYLPIGKCSGILEVNMDTMEWDYIELKPSVRGILGITQEKEYIWFTEHDAGAKHFYQLNMDNKQILKIELPCQDAFYAPLYYKNSLLFFQNYGRKSYRYELDSGKWEDLTKQFPGLENSSDKKVREDEIDYFSNTDKKFYHGNFKTNTAYYDEYQIEEENFLENSWGDYCEQCKRELQDNITNEGRLTIREYLEIVKSVQFNDYGFGVEKEDQSAKLILKALSSKER